MGCTELVQGRTAYKGTLLAPSLHACSVARGSSSLAFGGRGVRISGRPLNEVEATCGVTSNHSNTSIFGWFSVPAGIPAGRGDKPFEERGLVAFGDVRRASRSSSVYVQAWRSEEQRLFHELPSWWTCSVRGRCWRCVRRPAPTTRSARCRAERWQDMQPPMMPNAARPGPMPCHTAGLRASAFKSNASPNSKGAAGVYNQPPMRELFC